jgi:hypothetical protein
MKKVAVLILFGIHFMGFSQVKDSIDSNKKPAHFFGFGTGVNASTGYMGLASELLAQDQVFIRLSAGLGSWGGKFAFGLKIQKQKTSGAGFSIYYNYSTGLKNVRTDLEVKSTSVRYSPFPTFVTIVSVQKVSMNYLPASTVNFALSYNWLMKRSKLFLELNYGIKIEKAPYEFSSTANQIPLELTENSKKALRLAQPGGIGITFGFMFGL